MNILIMMSVGCKNLGDELILKNEMKLLKRKYEGESVNFRVFTYDIENQFISGENIKYLEYFPIGIKDPKNICRNIKNYLNFIRSIIWSDKVVIGGGGIIFDNEVGNYSNPLNQWLFRVSIANLFRKYIIFFGVSVDIKNHKNLGKVKNIFSKAKEVYVRDVASAKLLNEINIKSDVILDPVFYDNGEYSDEENFMVKKLNANDFSLTDLVEIDFKGKKVGLALRSGYLGQSVNKDENIIISEIIDHIINSGGEVILLSHSFHDIDKKANDLEFMSKFVKPGIEITTSMQETYEIYKQKKIDFCLSMRLHSMILSQVYKIPFINIKYAKKGDLM